MAKVYTSQGDEDTLSLVMRKGLLAQGPKWTVLRVALALSLKQPEPPDEHYDEFEGEKGSEYTLEILTGASQKETEGFVDAFCALLSAYHGQNLFDDEALYARLLQRHIRRGLREIGTSWRESHDFHEFLFQEFFSRADGPAMAEATQSPAVLHALEEIGLSAEILATRNGPRVSRHTVRLRDAEDYGRLERKLDDLAFTLGLKDAGVFASPAGEPKTVWLDVPRPVGEWQTLGLETLMSWQAPVDGLPMLLGVDIAGTPVVRDLVEAPHVLVAGTTGSGKSVCLHAMLLSLFRARSPSQVRCLLIDPKRVEFAAYRDAPHLRAPVVTEGVEALRALKSLVKEMDVREQRMSQHGAREWVEMGEEADAARIVVVVEELAALLAQAPEAEEPLVMLAQKARASGIHLILATQRPDAATFSGLLRANVPSRIALTVQKATDSRVVLDEVGAEKLLGKGDMLVKWLGDNAERTHGLHIRADDVTACLRRIFKESAA
jgi:S-DNA-T family DNA segregation ATPase FtsK/SpoIIIE